MQNINNSEFIMKQTIRAALNNQQERVVHEIMFCQEFAILIYIFRDSLIVIFINLDKLISEIIVYIYEVYVF